jgi:hypothetical protein
MSELLQVIADRHTLFLTDLGNAIEDEARVIIALPAEQQGRRALDAARTSLGEVLVAPSATIGWIAQFEERLQQGINGDRFRLLVRTGDVFIRACLAMVERVSQLWDKAEGFSGETDEVNDAREKISAARKQLLAMQPQMAQWRKVANRKSPEIDPAMLERGVEQIRQGRFKTGEQIEEAIRNRNSPK